ncbi:MAG: hypothetical protein OWS74_00565, partial [Firmicutes bacterium]|nr:hypothetical protein [Bacillota bacterium]
AISLEDAGEACVRVGSALSAGVAVGVCDVGSGEKASLPSMLHHLNRGSAQAWRCCSGPSGHIACTNTLQRAVHWRPAPIVFTEQEVKR